MQSYQYLDDVAISDLAFEAVGDTPKEMFEAAGQALSASMVDVQQVKPRVEKTIRLRHEALDQLMFDWLAELIYLKDAEGLLFSRFRVDLIHNGVWELNGKVSGETIDAKRHTLHLDVKAVTYHQLQVKEQNGQWIARVVLDI
jgi:SHS2 domain-containing protein